MKVVKSLLAMLFVTFYMLAASPAAMALESSRVADCPSGYTNMGLTCYRGPDSMNNGGSTVADCPTGFTNMGLTCQRDADTISNGGSIVADCPSGFTNTGLFCQRDADTQTNNGSTPANCPTGFTNTGLFCQRDADTQPNGGSVAANCPAGYTNTGLSCLRPADTQSNGGSSPANCPSGYTNTGLTCFRGVDTYSAPSTVANCPSGYTNTGLTCFRGANTIAKSCTGYTNLGLIKVCSSYSSCPSGYYSTGLFCQRDPSTLGLSSMSCPSGRFFSAGRCYVSCPSGYANIGEFCSRGASTLDASAFTCPSGTFLSTGRCYQPCPSGYTNTGVSCYRGPDTLGESALTCPTGSFYSTGRCYQPCPSGYTNTGISCYREPVIYGLESMTCPSGRFLSAGRCYLPCPTGYTNTGVSCYREPVIYGLESMTCPNGRFFSAGRCYLPCPTGYANTGVSCYREPVIYGLESMTCASDRFFSTGRCYLPCPEGYSNTGVSCFRPADSLGASSMSCNANELLQGVRCFPNTSAELNGAQPKPFWIYGHNPNTQEEAEAALQAGANALEPDIMYLSGAQYYVGQTLPDALYVYHDPYKVLTRVPQTLEAYLDGIHDLAVRYPALSLIALDIKSQAATAAFGTQIWNAVQDHLLRVGKADEISLNVLYSVGTRDDGAVFDNIIAKLGPREGVQVDSEDDPEVIKNYFLNKGASNIGFGDGTLGANLSGIGPNTLSAIEQSVWWRADSNSPKTAYAFAISDKETLKEYITTGVDAIITDDVESLATIVAGRTDIRLATRDDNPFTPRNEAYALKIKTGDVADGGTDSNVTFTLTGCLGQSSAVVDTSRIGRMERGSTNYLAIPSKDLGRLTSLAVSRDDAGSGPGWWLDKVDISSFNYLSSGFYSTTSFTAPYQNWVPTTGLTATLSTDPCNIAVKGKSLTRQRGSLASAGILASVLHTEARTQLSAKVSPGADVTGIDGLTALTSSNNGAGGTITANLGVACDAALGSHVIAIEVVDSYTGLTALDNATVNVTANTPPVLGTYSSTSIVAGGGVSIRANLAPSDNGQIVNLTASAPGFTGSFAGNPATGTLSISNAGPMGEHTVSVIATDNCAATTTQTFQLTVNAPPTPKLVVGNAASARSANVLVVPLQLTVSGSMAKNVVVSSVVPQTTGFVYQGQAPGNIGDLPVNSTTTRNLTFAPGSLANGAIAKFIVSGTYQDTVGKLYSFSSLRVIKIP